MSKKVSLGIGSYAYAWNLGVPGYPAPKKRWTAFDLVEATRNFGLSVLELDDNVPLAEFSGDEIADLRRAAESAGIQLEIGTRGTDPAQIEKYIRIAEKLGVTLLRSVFEDKPEASDKSNAGPGLVANSEQQGLDFAKARLRESLPALESKGIILALENYERYSSTGLLSVVEALGSNHIEVCLDTVNSFGYPEDQKRVIETLAPVTVNLHIKDFTIARLPHKMGFSLEGRPAGEGMLSIEAAIEAVLEQRSSLPAIIETWPPWSGDIEETADREREWAGRSVENMKRRIK